MHEPADDCGLTDVLSALERKSLRDIMRNSEEIYEAHGTRYHSGDLVVFRTGDGPDHDPGRWAPYTAGEVRVIDLDCRHHEMMSSPEVVRLIADRIEE